jgi:hypothetical protein
LGLHGQAARCFSAEPAGVWTASTAFDNANVFCATYRPLDLNIDEARVEWSKRWAAAYGTSGT